MFSLFYLYSSSFCFVCYVLSFFLGGQGWICLVSRRIVSLLLFFFSFFLERTKTPDIVRYPSHKGKKLKVLLYTREFPHLGREDKDFRQCAPKKYPFRFTIEMALQQKQKTILGGYWKLHTITIIKSCGNSIAVTYSPDTETDKNKNKHTHTHKTKAVNEYFGE